jgi:hypothetical protein
MAKSRRILLALGVALLIGIGGPALDVAVKCARSRARVLAVCPTPDAERRGGCPPTSEACVWGKSLLPISIAASLLFLALPAALLAYWWAGRAVPGRRRRDAGRSLGPPLSPPEVRVHLGAPSHRPAECIVMTSTVMPSPHGPLWRGATVLVVDDEPGIRRVVRRALEVDGG